MVPDWNVSWSAARRRHWTEIKIEIFGCRRAFPFFLFILMIDNVLKQHLNIFDTGQDKLSSTAATVWCYIVELFKLNTKKIKANTENIVRFLNPLAPDIQIHVSWGTRPWKQCRKYSRSNRHLPPPSEWDTARAIQLLDKLQLPSLTFFSVYFPTGPPFLRSLLFNSSKDLLLPKAMNILRASLSMKAIYCLTSFT